MRFGEWGKDVVANTKEQSQLRGNLPAILREDTGLPAAIVGRGEVEVAGCWLLKPPTKVEASWLFCCVCDLGRVSLGRLN